MRRLSIALATCAIVSMTATRLWAAAATPSVSFPPNLVATNTSFPGSIAWNSIGNRCQYDCAAGANASTMDVGIAASGLVAIPSGGLTSGAVFSDGKKIGIIGGTVVTTFSGYDIVSLSARTQCGTSKTCNGTGNGTPCSTNADCPVNVACVAKFCNQNADCGSGDTCRLCDGTGNCSSDTSDGPCTRFCLGGTTDGAPCSVTSDCGGTNPICLPQCRLLQNCAKATAPNQCTGGPLSVHDCTATTPNSVVAGASVIGSEDSTIPNITLGTRPLHSARIELYPNNTATGNPLGATETVYRVVASYNSPFTPKPSKVTCRPNVCSGTPNLVGSTYCN